LGRASTAFDALSAPFAPSKRTFRVVFATFVFVSVFDAPFL
jgi:hypothetical protein